MFFQHEVVSNKVLNEKFNLIRLRSKSAGFNFKIGQFTTVKIDPTTYRCYSIASLPEELPYWNIFVDITPGGPGTKYLKSLTPGQIIETLSVVGKFELNIKLKKCIFGAIGCGIAPFLPMIKKLSEDENNELYIYWGLRTEKDIALEKMLKQYSKSSKKIHFEVILSKPSNKWKGKKGHITNEILKIASDATNRNMGIYLSGSGEFILEAQNQLKKQKYPLNRIYHEACY
jgi:CDP-4-dehydro-6-deoxyglucose reductase, E3